MAQRPRVQAANLHDDTFGYPGAAQVARSSLAQIIGRAGRERRLGTEAPERPHSRLKTI
jgi:hypothetical protein